MSHADYGLKMLRLEGSLRTNEGRKEKVMNTRLICSPLETMAAERVRLLIPIGHYNLTKIFRQVLPEAHRKMKFRRPERRNKRSHPLNVP